MDAETNPGKPDFEDLARRLIALEPEAYQAFADYFGPALIRFLSQQGLNETDAEELAATCIGDAALKVRTKYRAQEGGSFQAWVYQLARNKLTDWFRARRRQAKIFVDFPSASGVGSDLREFEEQLASTLAVQAAMAQLSDLDREIIEFRIWGSASFEAIAAELGIEIEAARQRFHRASKRIAEILSRDTRFHRPNQKVRKSA
jgi:RNA polymerase sigma factor (sigma-70 family)